MWWCSSSVPFMHACWGIVTVHMCWVLIAVRVCWCWALIHLSSVVFILHSLVIGGCVAGRLWLQVSSHCCCPHLDVVSCHIIVFTCCGWCWAVVAICGGGVGGPLWPFMGAGGRGGPSLSLVVVMGCCVGVLSAHHVCWLCCGSMLLLGRGCAVSLLSGCGRCAMLLLSGHGCHVSLSCGVNKRKEGGGCPDSPDVDGDDIVHLHRQCQEGEGQRVVMGREEEVCEKIG